MSENALINIIRSRPSCRRLWDRLSDGGKRRVLEIANGSDVKILNIIEDMVEEERG